MSDLKLRDRDAIVTKEGLIFRVFGYSHPSDSYICDAEYAPASIFKSDNPKAFRNKGHRVFYKFYEDEGWQLVHDRFPRYLVFHEMLQQRVVGVSHNDIVKVRKPEAALKKLIFRKPRDKLETAMQDVLGLVTEHSGLHFDNFGVFGSMLHNFHHPDFSDVDLTIYGREKTARLRTTLQKLYEDGSFPLTNEFATAKSLRGKSWRFRNLNPKEFVWHQRGKMIYSLFSDEKSGRIIKVEFEPVKDWVEITSDYDPETRIVQKGWAKMLCVIVEAGDAPFIPSVYSVKPLEILCGKDAGEVTRVVSYMEEFRLQANRGEKVYVEGNLEEVITSKGHFHQVALTYCPRYYEQVLKVAF